MAEISIDAELRLGPPGSGCGGGDAAAKKRPASSSTVKSEASGTAGGASPASKVQVVGWPPVGSFRRSTFQSSSKSSSSPATATAKAEQGKAKKKINGGGGIYVKVSMDGAPYLRKVDLRMYGGYGELRDALDALFGGVAGAATAAGGHFAVAYEDKDGDLMLAGDDVYLFLQEVEDNARIRSKMMTWQRHLN
uniref:Auxin-responsive protein n=1 Tax=Leersia perrieri TaxID=77586 RepID=A0A0D9W062_9ORYZ